MGGRSKRLFRFAADQDLSSGGIQPADVRLGHRPGQQVEQRLNGGHPEAAAQIPQRLVLWHGNRRPPRPAGLLHALHYMEPTETRIFWLLATKGR